MIGGSPWDFVDYIRDNQDTFWHLLRQHVELVGLSVLLGILIALPLAILANRVDWLAKPLNWLANVGQTIPSLAVLGLTLPYLGIGFRPSLFALTILAVLPIFLNAYVGIRSADPAVVDAARGMGTSSTQLLLMVELPLASPVIYAGVRTAIIQNIGLATLAAYIGGGGFGDWILQGLAMVSPPILFAGGVSVAVLAILTEIVLGRLRYFIIPAGLRADRSQ